MSVPTLVRLIRFAAETCRDMHRYCVIYFAEDLDAGERRKQQRRKAKQQ